MTPPGPNTVRHGRSSVLLHEVGRPGCPELDTDPRRPSCLHQPPPKPLSTPAPPPSPESVPLSAHDARRFWRDCDHQISRWPGTVSQFPCSVLKRPPSPRHCWPALWCPHRDPTTPHWPPPPSFSRASRPLRGSSWACPAPGPSPLPSDPSPSPRTPPPCQLPAGPVKPAPRPRPPSLPAQTPLLPLQIPLLCLFTGFCPSNQHNHIGNFQFSSSHTFKR